MTALIIGLVGLVGLIGLALLVIGFRLGRSYGDHQRLRLRLQAAQAQRRMHDLTRQVFTAMAEAAEQRRRKGEGGRSA